MACRNVVCPFQEYFVFEVIISVLMIAAYPPSERTAGQVLRKCAGFHVSYQTILYDTKSKADQGCCKNCPHMHSRLCFSIRSAYLMQTSAVTEPTELIHTTGDDNESFRPQTYREKDLHFVTKRFRNICGLQNLLSARSPYLLHTCTCSRTIVINSRNPLVSFFFFCSLF